MITVESQHNFPHRAILVAVLVLLAACGQPKIIEPAVPRPDLVWPKPPAIPRIRFLYSLSTPEDMQINIGMIKKVWDFIKGEVERPIVRPYGVTKDNAGRLYVVDTFYNAVHVFDRKDRAHYTFPQENIPGYGNPIDVASGADGRIYVSDSGSNLVHVFSKAGRKYVTSIGSGQLKRPTGLVVNHLSSELLVVDTLASQVVVYDESTLSVKRIVGKDSQESEGFHYPTNITVSNEGLIYVTDSLNFRIQMLSADLEFLASFGTAGDSPGRFSRPKGLATDSYGHVYVVDALFGNVQVFDSDGLLLMAFGSPGQRAGQFWLPNAIYIDEQDRIFVSDSYNGRVQVFQYLAVD